MINLVYFANESEKEKMRKKRCSAPVGRDVILLPVVYSRAELFRRAGRETFGSYSAGARAQWPLSDITAVHRARAPSTTARAGRICFLLHGA